MKLESLAIIFVIIIIPIAIVLSEYVDNKIEIASIELEYDTRLSTSASEAITAFQISNVNNSYNDNSTLKLEDIEAAANSYLNSLALNFGYTGYNVNTMKEYVPAIVFTLYDGYYLYAPFKNTLNTTLKDDGSPELKYGDNYTKDEKNIDPAYENGITLYGLKPYVSYSCRYQKDNNDIIITYSLDNYITVQGIVNGEYVYQYGYLINGIKPDELTRKEQKDSRNENIYGKYTYKGITFSETETETLKEYVGDTVYPYVKINGIKYYLDEENDTIFYIDNNGFKCYDQFKDDPDYKQKLVNAIKNNKSAYEYYKDAYSFTKWVENNLSGIETTDAVTKDISGNTTFIKDDQRFENSENNKRFNWTKNYIFGSNSRTVDYEKSNSLFNEHRRNVIRYVVETNLSTSIAAFSSNASSNFVMPKISETDWDLIENDVCLIGFLQGLNMGQKMYNGYAVVPNTLTKEYVDENNIYILTKDGYYSKANDNEIIGNLDEKTDGYYSGIWKLNFERKKYKQKNDDLSEDTIFYLPNKALGSYSSIVGSYGLKETGIAGSEKYSDMYAFMEDSARDPTLKKVYFKALARERCGSYHVNNNNNLKYFLDEY